MIHHLSSCKSSFIIITERSTSKGRSRGKNTVFKQVILFALCRSGFPEICNQLSGIFQLCAYIPTYYLLSDSAPCFLFFHLSGWLLGFEAWRETGQNCLQSAQDPTVSPALESEDGIYSNVFVSGLATCSNLEPRVASWGVTFWDCLPLAQMVQAEKIQH